MPNSWLGVDQNLKTYIYLYNNAVSEAGAYEITTEIFNQEKQSAFAIENFKLNLINPCIGAAIINQKIKD